MDAITEDNLASEIEGTYCGELVASETRQLIETTVRVIRLNSLLVRVEFELRGKLHGFRGMLTSNDEGILMIVQEKIERKFLLTGMSGFMHDRPNVHGGFIRRLDGFYFHIVMSQLSGNLQELYFFGKLKSSQETVVA